jgi:TPR repeat protein
VLAPGPTVARLLFRLLLTTGLFFPTACRGSRPFELPPRTEVPAHPCADSGVSTCERACNEQSDGDACLVASVAHAEGLGGPKDSASMQAFELRACDLGVALGCEHYANNFRRSEDEDELDLAREHYERACRGGRAENCARAGSLALRLDADGEPQDARAAFELYGRACDGGALWACAVVGDMLTFGIGTSVDVERAAASFRKACAPDEPAGCHNAEPHAEHWLTGGVAVMFEQLHAPDPVFAVEGAPYGWRVVIVTRTCFGHAAIEPVSVQLVEPSGVPELDALVLETLQGWRFRARPGWTFEQPVCVPNVFDIRKQ